MELENEKCILVAWSVSWLVCKFGLLGFACRFDDGCHCRIESADMHRDVCIYVLLARENREATGFDAVLCASLAFVCDCLLSVCRFNHLEMTAFSTALALISQRIHVGGT